MAGFVSLSAQELRAVVSVNSDAIQGGNSELFHTLEKSLHRLLNGERWGDEGFTSTEKINASFMLLLTERLGGDSFRGELYVQSNRADDIKKPGLVMLSLRDKEVDFDYTPQRSLQFDVFAIRDNLTAVVAYYAFLIVALEKDAVEPLGGTPYFRKMEQIVFAVQSNGWRGWEMGDRYAGRAALASAFNDGTLEDYRKMWFDLHSNPQPAPAVDAVSVLYQLHAEHPGHPILTLFANTRLKELVVLLAQSDEADRRFCYHRLAEIFPTREDLLVMLRE